jgi:hypothetical protein
MADQKIIKARITAMPKSVFDTPPEVYATFEDGKEYKLFSFYPDEIQFVAEEFIGLTSIEAGMLRHKKDVAYLKS